MKKLICLYLLPLLVFVFQRGYAQQSNFTSDSTTFYYVLENPKYFGDNARSWFEITGLNDKKVQDKINKVLRKTFLENTNFEHTGKHGWSQGKDTVTPEGFTDYTYTDYTFYGQPYGIGWVRFKDSDSVMRIWTVKEGYGMGDHLKTFHFVIAPGKMAYICLHVWDKKQLGKSEEADLTFSLVDGREMKSEYVVGINPALMDSLAGSLDHSAEATAKNPDGSPLNCKLIPGPMSSTCTITAEAFIYWLNHETFGAPSSYGRSYSTECDPPQFVFVSVGLPLKLMIPFLVEAEWNLIKEIYK